MPAPATEDAQPVSLSPALIVEDDPAMQARLGYVLSTLGCDDTRITVTDSVAGARRLLDAQAWGVVLVDIGLADGSAVALIDWLQLHHPGVPAVAICAWRSEDAVFAALCAGAIGYLPKERDDLELSIALRSIEQGGSPIEPAIARRIVAWLATPPAQTTAALVHGPQENAVPTALPGAFTPREREILALVSHGLGNREMAEALSVSRLTVECHTRSIYRKLAQGSRTGAVSQEPGHARPR